MTMKDTITNALDADGDGKVTAKEVFKAVGDRAVETKDAAATAAESIKEGFDANADGKVSADEVKQVAEAAKKAVMDKVEGATKKPAQPAE